MQQPHAQLTPPASQDAAASWLGSFAPHATTCGRTPPAFHALAPLCVCCSCACWAAASSSVSFCSRQARPQLVAQRERVPSVALLAPRQALLQSSAGTCTHSERPLALGSGGGAPAAALAAQ